MSADASASSLIPAQASPQDPPVAPEPAAAAASGPLVGDPMALGLPCFIAGSVSLGLALVGVVPAAAIGAALPIILTATSVGLFLATIWSASLGQSAVASVFGIFAGFWLSYAVLVLGLTHNWFGVAAASVQATQELFLVAWLVVIVMLTLATLRLPLAYTAVYRPRRPYGPPAGVPRGQRDVDPACSRPPGYVVLASSPRSATSGTCYASTASVATVRAGQAYPLGTARRAIRNRATAR